MTDLDVLADRYLTDLDVLADRCLTDLDVLADRYLTDLDVLADRYLTPSCGNRSLVTISAPLSPETKHSCRI